MPRWRFAGLLALLALAAGCLGTPGERVRQEDPQESVGEPAPDTQPPATPAKAPPVRFLAWGDSGHGTPDQHRVAEAARRVCEAEGCDFVLQLGDNIYFDGVMSVDDPQFRTKFELPYANLSLPFYAVLGNHDVAKRLANRPGDNGDFQVAYDDAWGGPSTKWNMPKRNYTFSEGDAAFFALDLTPIMNHQNLTAKERAAAERLAGEIDGTNATWRIAFSHFPYVSNGEHGSAGAYDGEPGRGGAVKDYLEASICDRADLYVAAHDHDLEWLKAVPACGATEFVVSGAASEPDSLVRSDAPAWFSRGDTLGFFWFEVDGNALTGRAYDVDGDVLFARVLEK